MPVPPNRRALGGDRVTRLAGKRILVTGGGGFLGRRVCALLKERGAGSIAAPRRIEHDLCDRAAVARLFEAVRPEIVVHLAAEVGGIGANRASPGRFFYANMAMGLNVIEASRIAGVGKLVHIGSACAYPKDTAVPFSETELWNGYPEKTNAAYGIAKRSLLVMLQAYREQYGLAGIHLVPANLYGPGDNFDPETGHVVPALIRRFCAAGEQRAHEVVLWGSGEPSREFLHVDDAARAIVLATERYDSPEPVNLGTGAEIRIRDLAALIARLCGFQGRTAWDTSRPDGQPRRRLDTGRAERCLGFRAAIGLEEGLRDTIAWWRSRDG